MLLPVYAIKCEGCGREFDWVPNHINDAPPNYHSRHCRENARRRRMNQERVYRCPHPFKRVYPTHELAQAKCNELQDVYLKPYRCRCGAIHIGHARFRIIDWREDGLP